MLDSPTPHGATCAGGQAVIPTDVLLAQKAVPAKTKEPEELLSAKELAVIREACQVSVDLMDVASWADVRGRLSQCVPEVLAGVLRANRRAIRPETQRERADKVLTMLRDVVRKSADGGHVITAETRTLAAADLASQPVWMATRLRARSRGRVASAPPVKWRLG